MSGYIFGAFYDITRRIPAGKVATYGQIARLIGRDKNSRLFDVYAPGTQRALLEAEGVPFTPDSRVDLTACLWDGKLY